MLAEALRANGMTYEATDLSRQTYLLLKKKRQSAIKHRSMFEAEGHRQWFEMLLGQTACSDEPFDRFKEKMARYIYVIRK
jgi:hypothetical protein